MGDIFIYVCKVDAPILVSIDGADIDAGLACRWTRIIRAKAVHLQVSQK